MRLKALAAVVVFCAAMFALFHEGDKRPNGLTREAQTIQKLKDLYPKAETRQERAERIKNENKWKWSPGYRLQPLHPTDQPDPPRGYKHSEALYNRNIDYISCLMVIDNVAQQFGYKPLVIVDSGMLKSVRFYTGPNESALVTRSKLDNKMVVTGTLH